MNFIEKMRESNSELIKAEAIDLEKWSKLRHTKEDLELFLQFNIAEIKFRTKDGEDRMFFCTSNIPLVNIMKAKKKADKKKLVESKSSGIHTKDKRSVNTIDLIDMKEKTMMLNSWQIINFISITPENILVLDEILKKVM